MPADTLSYKGGDTLTFFAVGGTGIRTIEPLLHLCAAGLGPRKLRLVLIDPDLSNAAVAKARELIDLYARARDAVGEKGSPSGYFRTEVTSALGDQLIWSPVADGSTTSGGKFGTRMDRALMQGTAAPLGVLFDTLFAKRYRDMDLTLGFRGVPSIGTVFMNRIREQPWFRQLLTDRAAQGTGVYFAVGSIFGGTGAAALPVIGQALVTGVPKEEGTEKIDGVPSSSVGAAVVLPFFTLPPAATALAPDGGPRPQGALFAQNAAAAIPAYTSGLAKYGTVYVIGDNEPRQQPANEVGGPAQDNRSDYVELYASLAALEFSARGGAQGAAGPPTFYYTAVSASHDAPRKNVGWVDLPLTEGARQRLQGAFVSAHTFLRLFRPDGKMTPGLKHLFKGATWAELLGMRGKDFESRSTAFNVVGEYYMAMWRWLSALRLPTPAMDLVRTTGAPTTVRLDETLSEHRTRRQVRDDFEIFRHWNDAAYARTGEGSASFWDVMRRGSESFVGERFEPTVRLTEEA